MKRFYVFLLSLVMICSLCGCAMSGTNDNSTTTEPTQESTESPTENTTSATVPETTESRGSTDDKPDDENESLPEDVERIRRRLLK